MNRYLFFLPGMGGCRLLIRNAFFGYFSLNMLGAIMLVDEQQVFYFIEMVLPHIDNNWCYRPAQYHQVDQQ